MAAIETLNELENLLDGSPSFRKAGGHVNDRRDRSHRAQSPPQRSKAGQKKQSPENRRQQNGSNSLNEREQSDSESDDDQKRAERRCL